MNFKQTRRWIGGHPDQVIIGAWVSLMLLEFLPALVRGLAAPKCALWFFEMGLFNLPYWEYTGAMLKQGLFPTWTPQVFCGFPATAYSGTNLFFPPFYLLMFLDFARASTLETLVGFALAGAFGYLGFRRLELSPVAALVAMLASVGSMLTLWESSYTWGEREVLAFALSGWGVAGLSQSPPRLRHWFGVVLGMFLLLSYHVELFIYSAVFFQIVALSRGPARLRQGLIVASAIAAGVLAMSAGFLGILEFAPDDARGRGVTFNYFLSESLGPEKFLETILPLPALYLGYPSFFYVGLSVVWLAGRAALSAGRRGFTQVAAILLILMLAVDLWPLPDLLYRLPLFDRLLLHYYLGPSALVLIAVLAGRGAEQVIESGFRSSRAGLIPALIGLVLAAGAIMNQSWLRVSLLLALTLAAGAAVLIPGLLQSRTRRAFWIAALVAVDLTLLFVTRHPWSPMKWFAIHPEAREFLERNEEERFWVLSRDSFHDILLHPNLGMRLGPLLPGTSSPLGFWRHTPIRTAELINLISPGYLELKDGKLNALRRDRPTGPNPFGPQALPLLSVLNVGWIISNGVDLPEMEALERRPGKKFSFFHNPGVLPRTRTVSRWRVAEDGEESLAMMASGKLDFPVEAVVEARAGRIREEKNGGLAHQVRVNQTRPGYWDLELGKGAKGQGESASLLVVAETLVPGWRAFLDGEEVPLQFAYHAFMGVEVPPGPHRVVVVHRPWATRIGLWLSLCSIFCWPGAIGFRALFFH